MEMSVADVQGWSTEERNVDEKCLNSSNHRNSNNAVNIRSYRMRFWVLSLFMFETMLVGLSFSQYATMMDITMCFYNVSAVAANWTSLINMVVYIVLVLPASWFMNKVGLENTCIMGSLFSTCAFMVQFASLSSDGFEFVMLSQFFESLANVLVISIPPYLAATWFPRGEVSRACAAGIFGNQAGKVLMFTVSPLLLPVDCEKIDLITNERKTLTIISTSFSSILLFIIIFTFQNKPEYPPSIAQANKKNFQESYRYSLSSMVRNVNFILLFLAYGLVGGSCFATVSSLTKLFLYYFPDNDVAADWMAVTLITAGLLGCIVSGYIMDYTHRFKEISLVACSLSFISYVIFCCLLPLRILWIQHATLALLGFFLISYLPVGFEYGIELTYPASEVISASLLNAAIMVFGLVITEISGFLLKHYDPLPTNIMLSMILLTSTFISCFITKEFKRSKKYCEETINRRQYICTTHL